MCAIERVCIVRECVRMCVRMCIIYIIHDTNKYKLLNTYIYIRHGLYGHIHIHTRRLIEFKHKTTLDYQKYTLETQSLTKYSNNILNKCFYFDVAITLL